MVCLDHDGLVVPGCEKKSAIVIPYPELEQRLEEKKTKIPSRSLLEPLNLCPRLKAFLFDPDGLRDPFRPIEKSVEAMATQAVETNGIQPDF